jgi:hypothetical protein
MATNNICDEPTAASGKFLQGQGVGTASAYSTATYPSTATTAGTILRADGTNWVATTATFPDTAGTSGNVLTSDGTNWSSATPPGGGALLVASGVLTNSQIKNLHGTPIAIVAAPASGKVIVPVEGAITLNYGGTNVFTAAAAQTISLYYSTTLSIKVLLSNSNITTAGSRFSYESLAGLATTTLSSFSALALNLYNPIATEISGNAANDNTISYAVCYYVMTP